MQEYFDHYGRGLPAADWIKDGVPRLQMDEHLKSRQKMPKAVSWRRRWPGLAVGYRPIC